MLFRTRGGRRTRTSCFHRRSARSNLNRHHRSKLQVSYNKAQPSAVPVLPGDYAIGAAVCAALIRLSHGAEAPAGLEPATLARIRTEPLFTPPVKWKLNLDPMNESRGTAIRDARRSTIEPRRARRPSGRIRTLRLSLNRRSNPGLHHRQKPVGEPATRAVHRDACS